MKKMIIMIACLLAISVTALANLPYDKYANSGTGAMNVSITHSTNFTIEQVVFKLSGNATTSESIVCTGSAGGKVSENMLGNDDLIINFGNGYLLSKDQTFTCTYPGSDGLDWDITIWYRR